MKRRIDQRILFYHWKMAIMILLVGLAVCSNSEAQDPLVQLTDSLNREIENAPESKQIAILNELANLYWSVSFEKSIHYSTQALEIAKKTDNTKSIADSYNSIGVAYATLEIYEEAIGYFEKARDLRKTIDDRRGLVNSLNNLGVASFNVDRTENSLSCFEEAAMISQELKNDTLLAGSYHNLGQLYSTLGNLTEAVSLLEMSKDHYKKSGNVVKRVEVLNLLGDLYLQLGDQEKALEKFSDSREECIRFDLINELSFAEEEMGRIYLEKNNTVSALTLIRSSLENAMTAGNIETISNAYFSLSEYYRKTGDQQKAFSYRRVSSAYKDTLFTRSLEKKLNTLQRGYDIESKDQELEVLRRNEELEKIEIQQNRYYRNLMIIVIIILITFSSISTYNLYQSKKSNIILEKQKQLLEETNLQLVESQKVQQNINLTKNKIFTVLEEDLITPFNLLLEYTALLEQNAHESNTKAIKKNSGIVHQSSKSLFQLLDNLLQWSRNQRGSVEYHPHYFDLYKTINHLVSVEEVSAHRKSIEFRKELQEALIVYADESHISIVVRNLINNAIKYSNVGGWVKIGMEDKNGFAEITISDNGVGISREDLEKLFRMDTHITRKGTANERGTGLGLIIAHDLIINNGGSIAVESKKGQGTRFTFSIPKIPAGSTRHKPDNHKGYDKR